jgi:AAA domain, putative AbiEii toxin, Type IV TA system
MKFELKKVGLIDEAEIDLADLTLLCGENNTGKTYVTYTLYGFLRSWRQLLANELRLILQKVLVSPKSQINLDTLFTGKINTYLEGMGKRYTQTLPRVFASSSKLLAEAEIKVSVSAELNFLNKDYQRSIKSPTGNKTIATLQKAKDSALLEILLADDRFALGRITALADFITDAIAEIVFAPYLPDVFIASAERTGAAIFRKELDFARTRLVEALGRSDGKALSNPYRLFEQMQSGYAWPVQDNVDFVRQLEDIDKDVSPLVETYPELLDAFEAVIGGTYKVVKGNGLYYQPKGSGKPRLTMSESSSSVRALLDIGFYLRCRAKVGDLLMIDEPELNLHPVNQRTFARLIVRLVNCGLKVFMTTHSDYLIKELNTLIMLNARTEHTQAIQRKYHYADEELMDPEKVRLFTTCTVIQKRSGKGKRGKMNGLRQAVIHPDQGIEVETFDTTIEDMNTIQTEILFGDD